MQTRTDLNYVSTGVFVGTETWPPGCSLKFCAGDNMSHVDRVMVDTLEPGQMTDVSIQMVSPATKGVYQGQWRMSTPTGVAFGGKTSCGTG